MSEQFERNTIAIRGEVATMIDMFRPELDWAAFEREAMLDCTEGPRLGPSRAELWEIERPARIVANIQRNLGTGRPVAPYRKR